MELLRSAATLRVARGAPLRQAGGRSICRRADKMAYQCAGRRAGIEPSKDAARNRRAREINKKCRIPNPNKKPNWMQTMAMTAFKPICHEVSPSSAPAAIAKRRISKPAGTRVSTLKRCPSTIPANSVKIPSSSIFDRPLKSRIESLNHSLILRVRDPRDSKRIKLLYHNECQQSRDWKRFAQDRSVSHRKMSIVRTLGNSTAAPARPARRQSGRRRRGSIHARAQW